MAELLEMLGTEPKVPGTVMGGGWGAQLGGGEGGVVALGTRNPAAQRSRPATSARLNAFGVVTSGATTSARLIASSYRVRPLTSGPSPPSLRAEPLPAMAALRGRLMESGIGEGGAGGAGAVGRHPGMERRPSGVAPPFLGALFGVTSGVMGGVRGCPGVTERRG